MRALVSASARFVITPDNVLWSFSQSLNYSFWSRYLDVYDEVALLVRAQPQASPPANTIQCSGPGILPLPLPYYEGFSEYIQSYIQLRRAIFNALKDSSALQLRVPCAIGSLIIQSLKKGRPYGLEVVGNPYDVFAPGAVRHPLRPAFRWWFTRQLRQQCLNACATAYVTQQSLQKRYPSATHTFTTYYSSVELTENDLISSPREICRSVTNINLIMIGSLAQLYKAPDVVIEAVYKCVQENLNLRLVVLGDGQYRAELENLANSLGLNERIRFLGQIPARDAVRAQLDAADLFVLPSRTEGLPRAMIEAMARGLPCVGSSVGGIPELLPAEDMVPPGDANALALKIREVVTNPTRMMAMSARNLEKARQYAEPILRQRRIAFYQYVKEATEAWLKSTKT